MINLIGCFFFVFHFVCFFKEFVDFNLVTSFLIVARVCMSLRITQI